MFTPTLRCERAQPASDRLMRKWCIGSYLAYCRYSLSLLPNPFKLYKVIAFFLAVDVLRGYCTLYPKISILCFISKLSTPF